MAALCSRRRPLPLLPVVLMQLLLTLFAVQAQQRQRVDGGANAYTQYAPYAQTQPVAAQSSRLVAAAGAGGQTAAQQYYQQQQQQQVVQTVPQAQASPQQYSYSYSQQQPQQQAQYYSYNYNTDNNAGGNNNNAYGVQTYYPQQQQQQQQQSQYDYSQLQYPASSNSVGQGQYAAYGQQQQQQLVASSSQQGAGGQYGSPQRQAAQPIPIGGGQQLTQFNSQGTGQTQQYASSSSSGQAVQQQQYGISGQQGTGYGSQQQHQQYAGAKQAAASNNFATPAPLTLPPHPPTLATLVPSLFPTPPPQPQYDQQAALTAAQEPYQWGFDFAPGTPVVYCSYGAHPIPVYNTPKKRCIPYHPMCGVSFTCIFDVDPNTGRVWGHAQGTKKK